MEGSARRVLWSISPASMEAFDREAKAAFVRKMAKEMGKSFPAERARQGLRMNGTVERGIALAQQHGMKGEPVIEAFLQLWFLSGFDLEARWPGSDKVLKDPGLSPQGKIDLLQALSK